MKQKILPFIKIAITAILFFLIFRNIDFGSFGATLRNARPGILIAAFILLWIQQFVCIFRWRMLIRPLMPAPSLKSLLGIYFIGLFFNLTLPTLVGGDVVKIYYVGKHSNSYSHSFAATFLDRDAGMLAMLIIACAGVLFHPVSVPGVAVEIIVWGAFAAFIVGNICLFAPKCHRVMTVLFERLHLAKLSMKMDRVSNVFHIIGKEKSILLAALLLSFLNQLLVIIVVWITAHGLRLQIPFSYFLIFVPVITLISMIPISLNGMGLREYAFLSLFTAIGVLPESCIALGLLTSLLIILSSLPGGIVYIFFRNKGDRRRFADMESEIS
jgi:uncharacterized protein (TIRG00374 family)